MRMSDARLSPAAACRYIEREWHLKLCPETLRRWVHKGALPALTTPRGRVLIDPAALEAVFRVSTVATDGND